MNLNNLSLTKLFKYFPNLNETNKKIYMRQLFKILSHVCLERKLFVLLTKKTTFEFIAKVKLYTYLSNSNCKRQ